MGAWETVLSFLGFGPFSVSFTEGEKPLDLSYFFSKGMEEKSLQTSGFFFGDSVLEDPRLPSVFWGGGTATWDQRRTCSQIAGGDGGSHVVGGLAAKRMESWTEGPGSEGRCLIRVKPVHPYIHHSKGGHPRFFTGALMHICTGAVLPWILQLLVGHPLTCVH